MSARRMPPLPEADGDVITIAKCSTHGLHGCRNVCFECDGPVEQVAMIPLAEHREVWAEAARNALRWRKRAEALEDAIEDLFLYEPGRKGYAAAARHLRSVLTGPDNEETT
jgi:hypothetical protein